MSWRRPIAVLVIAGSLALAVTALAGPFRKAKPRPKHPPATLAVAADTTRLPPGIGPAIEARSCVMCHSAMLIHQQAKDSLGWEKTIAQMEKWGVTLSPAEHDTLRASLLERFGPRAAR
jgi:hypothetical protein